MVNEYEIKQLSDVLKPYIPSNKTIMGYSAKCLTKPGDNYGSLLLAVDVVLDSNSEKEILHLVAKMCPPNEWIKKMFNVLVTFKKEADMYKIISKLFEEFQREFEVKHCTDLFARYYGSRINLDPSSNVVDDDAVLLLENLKVQGYSIGNRFEGFDLPTTECVIKGLAKLHSVGLALKLKKPDIFRERVKPILQPMKGFSAISDEIKESVQNALLKIMEKNEELVPHLEKVRNYMKCGEKAFEEGSVTREPFATIGHGDFWLNNIMIKRDDNEISVKILDFQIADYGSPARDVVFFLYTSVQRQIIDENSSKFIQLYYDTFIQTLQQFGCDLSPFTFEAFTEELKYEAKMSQLFHCLVMLSPIFAINGAMKEVKDLSPSDMLSTERHENYEPKVIHTVLSFIKNQWL